MLYLNKGGRHKKRYFASINLIGSLLYSATQGRLLENSFTVQDSFAEHHRIRVSRQQISHLLNSVALRHVVVVTGGDLSRSMCA